MKTSFEIQMSGDKTFDEINTLMKANDLTGGYGWSESILSRHDGKLVLHCHFKDERMKLRDILAKLDEMIVDCQGIFFQKIEIEDK